MVTGFSKYEGAGNDFIIVDVRNNGFQPEAALLARLCDRHFGIGADGVMLLAEDARYDCSMRYYHADGSEGEMCGNGARCFALFASHLGIGEKNIRFVAADGPHTAVLCQVDATKGVVELEMTAVGAIEESVEGMSLDTGVPHYVEFVPNVERVDLLVRGRALRYDTARFPQGTNVDFVEIEGPGRLRMRTYERGVEDFTYACGTGTGSVVLALTLLGQVSGKDVAVSVPGGTLRVTIADQKAIWLTGPTNIVCEGEIRDESLNI